MEVSRRQYMIIQETIDFLRQTLERHTERRYNEEDRATRYISVLITQLEGLKNEMEAIS